MKRVKVKVKLSWRLRRGMESGLPSLLLIFGRSKRTELSALRISPPRKFFDTHLC